MRLLVESIIVLIIMYPVRFVSARPVSLPGKIGSGQHIVMMLVNFMEMLPLKIYSMQMRKRSASGWRDTIRTGMTGIAS
jgi:hypothetical protein